MTRPASFVLSLVAIAALLVSSGQCQRFTGLNILGTGFDIFTSRSTASAIVNMMPLTNTSITYHGSNYSLPTALDTLLEEQACSLATTTSLYASAKQYTDRYHDEVSSKWSTSVGVEAPIQTAAGSGSVKVYGSSSNAVTSMNSYTQNEDQSITVVKVQCRQGIATVNLNDVPITGSFATTLQTLPTTYSSDTKDQFYTFFAAYGTHYYKSITLGTLGYHFDSFKFENGISSHKTLS